MMLPVDMSSVHVAPLSSVAYISPLSPATKASAAERMCIEWKRTVTVDEANTLSVLHVLPPSVVRAT